MTASEKEAFIARHEALAPDDSEIDTTDIPVSEIGTPHWGAKDDAVVAPVAQWCFRKGYQKGHAAALKEVQETLASLVASSKQVESSVPQCDAGQVHIVHHDIEVASL